MLHSTPWWKSTRKMVRKPDQTCVDMCTEDTQPFVWGSHLPNLVLRKDHVSFSRRNLNGCDPCRNATIHSHSGTRIISNKTNMHQDEAKESGKWCERKDICFGGDQLKLGKIGSVCMGIRILALVCPKKNIYLNPSLI